MMMIQAKKYGIGFAVVVMGILSPSLFSTHNANRYFHFLERSENYRYRKKSCVDASLFYTTASTAFKRNGGNTGIPELWGSYDLQDLFTSLTAVQGASTLASIKGETGFPLRFENDALPFRAEGKIKARGLTLQYEQPLWWNNLPLGVWVPFVHLNATSRFRVDKEGITQEQRNALSRMRRRLHDEIGLKENDWQEGGIGDIDLHARWNYSQEYALMMRNINIDLQVGTVIPSGFRTDAKNFASVPIMGNGHWGLYADIVPEFELKQDLKVGFLMGFLHQFKEARARRLAVFKEPTIFSALTANVEVDPGFTFKFSPYIIMQNLTDGIHFQARYTYLRHGIDEWRDTRSDADKKMIPSFLNQQVTADRTQEKIDENSGQKGELTKWRSHYITLQFLYNSKDAMHNLPLDPNVYFAYDVPVGGRGISKTHHVSLGVELHF